MKIFPKHIFDIKSHALYTILSQVTYIASTSELPAMNFQLGMNMDTVSPSILFQSGESSFDSDLIVFDDLVDAGNQFPSYFASYLPDNSVDVQPTSSLSSDIKLCQRPLMTSFCVDLTSLMTAMTAKAEKFVGSQSGPLNSLSSTGCIQYCNSINANVRTLNSMKNWTTSSV